MNKMHCCLLRTKYVLGNFFRRGSHASQNKLPPRLNLLESTKADCIEHCFHEQETS